ncbi:hypothetical protein MUK42_36782 [Musa troglodytarum]|uniref:Uncharacterized protein n=1 Tax=Musa troglodytarum TaxID=320322 RepID=A0A9E7E8W9_9LILI|nr:hypothetical protein MUK42_36782 [Musa troglodytarum]
MSRRRIFSIICPNHSIKHDERQITSILRVRKQEGTRFPRREEGDRIGEAGGAQSEWRKVGRPCFRNRHRLDSDDNRTLDDRTANQNASVPEIVGTVGRSAIGRLVPVSHHRPPRTFLAASSRVPFPPRDFGHVIASPGCVLSPDCLSNRRCARCSLIVVLTDD